jgi:uncharacterized RDD family membrane protein YckC
LLGLRLYVGCELERFNWNDFNAILIRDAISKRLAFMNCPLCGEVCGCRSEPLPAVSRSRAAELAAAPDSPEVVPEASVPRSQDAAWRDELSARLSRYRARRKVRPPRYPSLSLQFELPVCPNAGGSSQLPEFVPVSDHALALDEMRREPFAAAAEELAFRHPPVAEAALHPAHSPTGHLPEHSSGSSSSGSSSAQAFGNVSANSRAQGGAKIIEFPRSAWGPPPPPLDQLAEPVSERPRILEVPEVAPPPPALGGITIEAAEHEDAERRPGIDIPLQSAPLGLRLLAALVDGLIVAAASAVFGVIFWKVAAVRPPLAQILSLAVGIPCLFLPAYQYLLIVYAASTPGWRAAGLELARFDGTATNRSLRRWRVLAACLSGLSLGMGYAWVFLDEDALCWHDRITHTYLGPRKRAVATIPQPT